MSSGNRPRIPWIEDVALQERNATVPLLLELCHQQREEIQRLRDEIARLKGQKGKPAIKPSALEGNVRTTQRRPVLFSLRQVQSQSDGLGMLIASGEQLWKSL